ncbi:hypothetical protein [Methylobacterium sp. R2-1]|uniref:hypothetical protein n=1 Tax=Methylobacterium sp. R2-1 TaxID=2587064 RepID=UPI00161B2F50|nr:hypothetical protein [Methylobacterium sp. R2-1]MBB2959961.1 hypothetical protein [Methylobacterium sp. R2-1]
MPAPLPRAVFLALLGCALSACQSSAPPPVATVATAPTVSALPTGSGCGPTIARTQAIVAGDVKTGDLSAAVGTRFSADLDKAAGACTAGREGEAMSLLAAAKARYGYR